MKSRFLIINTFLVLGFLSIICGFFVLAKISTSASLSTLELTRNIDPIYASITEPYNKNIISGLAIDLDKRQILWEKNSDQPCLIASITKLMTALIVMEKLNSDEISLNTIIKATPEATKIRGSTIYLEQGELFTLEELLKAALIYSANDATYLIAQYIAGSEKKFVNLINERATKLGIHDTYFYNSTGLPPDKENEDKHNVSTCYDVAKLAYTVIQYPEIRRLSSTKYDYIRNGTFKMVTRNRLLRYTNTVDGLKTGHYSQAGWNLVATSLNDKKIMVIILGARPRRVRDDAVKTIIEHFLSTNNENIISTDI